VDEEKVEVILGVSVVVDEEAEPELIDEAEEVVEEEAGDDEQCSVLGFVYVFVVVGGFVLWLELDLGEKGGPLGMGFMEMRKKVANRQTGARPEAASRANEKMVGDRVRSWLGVTKHCAARTRQKIKTGRDQRGL